MSTQNRSARPAQRIAKLLARAGVASRRDVERMIAEGRVAVNGQVLETPATLLSSLHGVTVDGEPVQAAQPARLFAFHKPTGVLTTERDPAGRPTIYDRLPAGLPRLVPVGRLDLNTEGLLLMTTDGGLKRQLELPATGIPRTYRARAYGEVSQEALEELIEGVEIDGMRYGAIDANLERRTGANTWIEMTLTEGKNREVRRVLEHLGLRVSRLIRTRYGPFLLDELPVGAVVEIRQHDLVAFRKSIGAPGEAAPPMPASAGGAAASRPAAPLRPTKLRTQPVAPSNRAARRADAARDTAEQPSRRAATRPSEGARARPIAAGGKPAPSSRPPRSAAPGDGSERATSRARPTDSRQGRRDGARVDPSAHTERPSRSRPAGEGKVERSRPGKDTGKPTAPRTSPTAPIGRAASSSGTVVERPGPKPKGWAKAKPRPKLPGRRSRGPARPPRDRD